MTVINLLEHSLPGFEGADPVGTSLNLSGAVDRRTRPFRIGERVVLVVEAYVTGVEHKETKGGIVRSHKLSVGDAYELGGDRAPDLLETLHDEYTQWQDEVAGRQALPFDDPGDGTDSASAAAGAGPEARADAIADRQQEGDGWDGFDGDAPTLAACPDCDQEAINPECPVCGGSGSVLAPAAVVEQDATVTPIKKAAGKKAAGKKAPAEK